MKKTAIWVAAMAIAAVASAQKQDPVALKYSKLITPEFAKQQLSIIAADDMEGRETGQPGAEKAAQYLVSQYKALGLLPANKGSYFLDVPLVSPSFKVYSFAVNGTALMAGKDYNASGASDKKTVDVKEVVFVGYGDNITTNITGKVVMYIAADKPAKAGDPAPAGPPVRRRGLSPERMAIMANINSKKPALILAINPLMTGAAPTGGGFGGGRAGGGGGRMSLKRDETSAVAPVSFTISPDVASKILLPSGKSFADLKTAIDGGASANQTVKAEINASFGSEDTDLPPAKDIVAMIPGNDPKLKNEVLVFSAHYDHIGLVRDPNAKDKVNNGADDDGSGTTGILTIARAFAQAQKDGHGPRRTILFLGNVGEEKGLLGSDWYTRHPVFPLANTITDLNIDMIGRVGTDHIGKADSANYVYVIGAGRLSTDLNNVSEKANKTYTNMVLDYTYEQHDEENFYGRSDHYNFAKHGVPIIFYFTGTHADYHQPGDEVSKINFPALAKRAQLAFFTGWDLANADKRPVVDAKNAPKN